MRQYNFERLIDRQIEKYQTDKFRSGYVRLRCVSDCYIHHGVHDAPQKGSGFGVRLR